MFLKDQLEKIEGNIDLYVDMDGVIADYDVGVADKYDIKRPLTTSLKKLEEISQMPNVTLHILSITRLTKGFDEKHSWLDEFAPFFKKENRVIISREANNMEHSAELKAYYLRDLEKTGSTIVLIDDDPRILEKVKQEAPDIVLYKDTVLVD